MFAYQQAQRVHRTEIQTITGLDRARSYRACIEALGLTLRQAEHVHIRAKAGMLNSHLIATALRFAIHDEGDVFSVQGVNDDGETIRGWFAIPGSTNAAEIAAYIRLRS